MRPPAADLAPAPSKTQRKKDMHALQDLGTALVALDPAKLKSLDLPEPLAEAIVQARAITRHEARRRQLQYIGRLMRDVDAAPIQAALERIDAVPRAERARFAAAERWRDRLVADDDALVEFVVAHPGVDPSALEALVRDARAERAGGRPPHKFRALFRRICEVMPR